MIFAALATVALSPFALERPVTNEWLLQNASELSSYGTPTQSLLLSPSGKFVWTNESRIRRLEVLGQMTGWEEARFTCRLSKSVWRSILTSQQGYASKYSSIASFRQERFGHPKLVGAFSDYVIVGREASARSLALTVYNWKKRGTDPNLTAGVPNPTNPSQDGPVLAVRQKNKQQLHFWTLRYRATEDVPTYNLVEYSMKLSQPASARELRRIPIGAMRQRSNPYFAFSPERHLLAGFDQDKHMVWIFDVRQKRMSTVRAPADGSVAFSSKGLLFSVEDGSSLFRLSADRKSWTRLGPYRLLGTNLSGSIGIVIERRQAGKKLLLVTF